MLDFDYDPIISEKLYPEVQELFNLPVLEFNSKHFYISNRRQLQERDKLLYYLVAPYANLSLISTLLERDQDQYIFSPVGYTQDEKIYNLYRKYKIEVFTDLLELNKCITAFQ